MFVLLSVLVLYCLIIVVSEESFLAFHVRSVSSYQCPVSVERPVSGHSTVLLEVIIYMASWVTHVSAPWLLYVWAGMCVT